MLTLSVALQTLLLLCHCFRLTLVVLIFESQWAFEASNYNHLGNYSHLSKSNSSTDYCWLRETYSVVEQCHPCSGKMLLLIIKLCESQFYVWVDLPNQVIPRQANNGALIVRSTNYCSATIFS